MRTALLWGGLPTLITFGLILLWFDKIMLVVGMVVGWTLGQAFGMWQARRKQ